VSQFKRDMEEKMRDPEYAYEFGRTERELEIIKLLEELGCDCHNPYCDKMDSAALKSLIALIKGENK
jgi:hypothetical protein